MLDDDRLLALYSQELKELAAQVETPRILGKADLEARAISPICGSEVGVQLRLTGGKITDFGYDIEACALTKAVVAVMKSAIVGKTRAEVAAAGETLRHLLAGTEPGPAGDWAALKILAPVRDYRARHNAILLPFAAVEKAFEKKGI